MQVEFGVCTCCRLYCVCCGSCVLGVANNAGYMQGGSVCSECVGRRAVCGGDVGVETYVCVCGTASEAVTM